MTSRNNIQKLAFAGVVAALYAALTLSTPLTSYGPFQFRLSEALCILPFFFPAAVPGLFIGCFLANILSPYPLDMIVGPLATLFAAICTMRLGRTGSDTIAVKALACAPPVIFNAVIIGALIAWFETGGGNAFFPAMALAGLQVGFGELVIMYALGLPLMIYLPRTPFFKSLTRRYDSL